MGNCECAHFEEEGKFKLNFVIAVVVACGFNVFETHTETDGFVVYSSN